MFCGDLTVDDSRCQELSHASSKIVLTTSEASSVPLPLTAFILLNFACGTCPFLLPYTFRCGIIQAMVIGIIVLVLTAFSFYIFIRSWIFGTDNSYYSLFYHFFGSRAAWICQLALIIGYIGFCVSGLAELAEGFSSLFSVIFTSVPTFLQNSWVTYALLPFVFTMPLLIAPSFKRVTPYATAGVIGVTIGVIALLIYMIQSICKNGFDPNDRIVLWGKSAGDALYCFAAYNMAFLIHPFVPRVVQEMKDPSRGRIVQTFWIAMIFNSILNFVGGLSGYFIFFDSISDGNCLQYLTSHTPVVIIAKIANLIVAICTTASINYMNSIEICRIFHDGSEKNPLCRFSAGFAAFLLFCASAKLGSTSKAVWEAISGLIELFITYIAPSAFYLKAHGFSVAWMGALSVALIVVTVIIIVVLVCQQLGVLN